MTEEDREAEIARESAPAKVSNEAAELMERFAALPAEQRQLVLMGTQRTQVSSWFGPLPPPAALAEFDRVVPGSAQHIFSDWMMESEHRRKCEDRESRTAVAISRLGMWFGGATVLVVIAASVWLAQAGHTGPSMAVAGIAVGGVIGAFVTRRLRL